MLQDGLEAAEISLIPLKADAVFVGDITDSRIEKVRVLFAVGMTEDVPRNASDTAIVSDKEIARLADVKAMLEPTVAEVNLRARESVCLNLCTFLDCFVFSQEFPAPFVKRIEKKPGIIRALWFWNYSIPKRFLNLSTRPPVSTSF